MEQGDDPQAKGHATEWQTAEDEDGNTYYYNSTTGESQWEPPVVVKTDAPSPQQFMDDVIMMPDPNQSADVSCSTPGMSSMTEGSENETDSEEQGSRDKSLASTIGIPTPLDLRSSSSPHGSRSEPSTMSENNLSVRVDGAQIVESAEQWKSRPPTRKGETEEGENAPLPTMDLAAFYPQGSKKWEEESSTPLQSARSVGVKSSVSEVTANSGDYESSDGEEESEGTYTDESGEEEEEEESEEEGDKEEEEGETSQASTRLTFHTPRSSLCVTDALSRSSEYSLFLDEQKINSNAKNWSDRPSNFAEKGPTKIDSMKALEDFYPIATQRDWASASDPQRRATLEEAHRNLLEWGKRAKRIGFLREQAAYFLTSRALYAKEVLKLRHFAAQKLHEQAQRALRALPAIEEAFTYLQRIGKDAIDNHVWYSLRPEQQAALTRLKAVGHHALQREEVCQALREQGQEAVSQRQAFVEALSQRREEAKLFLQNLGKDAINNLPILMNKKRMQSAQYMLRNWANKALKHVEAQEKAQNELRRLVIKQWQAEACSALQDRAQRALNYWDRRCSAYKMLHRSGQQAIEHAILEEMGKNHREAYEYLKHRGEEALNVFDKRNCAFEFLLQKGQNRLQHLKDHEECQKRARSFLSQRAVKGVVHWHTKMTMVRPELISIARNAKVKVARDETQTMLSSQAKEERSKAMKAETFELLQHQGLTAVEKQAVLHEHQLENFVFLSELGQKKAKERWEHIERTLYRQEKAFEYLLMWAERAHNSFSLVDARADALSDLREAAQRAIDHLVAQEDSFAWLCELARHGMMAIQKLQLAKARMKLIQRDRTKQAWAAQKKHNQSKAKNMRIHVIQSGKAQSIVYPKKKGPPKAIHRNPRLPHVMELIQFERITGYEYQDETRDEIKVLIDRQAKGLVPGGRSHPSLRLGSPSARLGSPSHAHFSSASGLMGDSAMLASQESFSPSPVLGSSPFGSPPSSPYVTPKPSHQLHGGSNTERQGRHSRSNKQTLGNKMAQTEPPNGRGRKGRGMDHYRKKNTSRSPSAHSRSRSASRRRNQRAKVAWPEQSQQYNEKTQFMKQYAESKYANSLYSAISRSDSYLDSLNAAKEGRPEINLSRPASRTVATKPMLAFSEAHIKRKKATKLKPIRKLPRDVIEMRALGDQMIM